MLKMMIYELEIIVPISRRKDLVRILWGTPGFIRLAELGENPPSKGRISFAIFTHSKVLKSDINMKLDKIDIPIKSDGWSERQCSI